MNNSFRFLCLILIVLSMYSCSKSDGNYNKEHYVVNGVHDVNLNKPGGSVLPISLVPEVGITQKKVTISLSGLPPGVNAHILQAAGNPPFNSSITFTTDFTTPEGVYPVKITGTSDYGTKEYIFNMVVSGLNGWKLDTAMYYNVYLNYGRVWGSQITYLVCTAKENYGGKLTVAFNYLYPLPTTSGDFKIVSTPNADDEVSISGDGFFQHFNSTGSGAKTLHVKVDGQKYDVSANGVEVVDTLGNVRTVDFHVKSY